MVVVYQIPQVGIGDAVYCVFYSTMSALGRSVGMRGGASCRSVWIYQPWASMSKL